MRIRRMVDRDGVDGVDGDDVERWYMWFGGRVKTNRVCQVCMELARGETGRGIDECSS